MRTKFLKSVKALEDPIVSADLEQGAEVTNFGTMMPEIPQSFVDVVERRADELSAPMHGQDADSLNQQGMMEAEEIAESLRESGEVKEPFLLLAFEHRQEYADFIWDALLQKAEEHFFERVDGRRSCVIAAADESHINLLHATAAEVLNLQGYIQIQDGKPHFVSREMPVLN